ncbi:MAG: hypothetical protein ABIK83_05815 [Candidatus Zixiibacteriota bacterium]
MINFGLWRHVFATLLLASTFGAVGADDLRAGTHKGGYIHGFYSSLNWTQDCVAFDRAPTTYMKSRGGWGYGIGYRTGGLFAFQLDCATHSGVFVREATWLPSLTAGKGNYYVASCMIQHSRENTVLYVGVGAGAFDVPRGNSIWISEGKFGLAVTGGFVLFLSSAIGVVGEIRMVRAKVACGSPSAVGIHAFSIGTQIDF